MNYTYLHLNWIYNKAGLYNKFIWNFTSIHQGQHNFNHSVLMGVPRNLQIMPRDKIIATIIGFTNNIWSFPLMGKLRGIYVFWKISCCFNNWSTNYKGSTSYTSVIGFIDIFLINSHLLFVLCLLSSSASIFIDKFIKVRACSRGPISWGDHHLNRNQLTPWSYRESMAWVKVCFQVQ